MNAEGGTRPKDIGEYRTWLRSEHGVTFDSRDPTYHDSLTLRFREDFESSEFWTTLLEELPEYGGEYEIRTSYDLLMNKSEASRVLRKSYASFFLKTFRKNVLENPNWPDPPVGGWYLPENWYERINDSVRTTIVVKYLDGVQYLADKLTALADSLGVECMSTLEAKEEGYYAAHVYVRSESVVPKMDWDTIRLRPLVEVQVTTQLQDVIRRLLHRYYDDRRQAMPADRKWQWEYTSDEFVANYLGHILHYVEGMIMEIREKQHTEAKVGET